MATRETRPESGQPSSSHSRLSDPPKLSIQSGPTRERQASRRAPFASVLIGFLLHLQFFSPVTPVSGQERAQLLAHGEFSLALEQNQNLSSLDADRGLREIALAQFLGGASQGAWQTAGQIQNGQLRNETLGGLFGPGSGEHSGAGGVTEADFQPLIDLIQSTIAPDEWSETGQGDGTIQPWAAGVYVDPAGTLQRIGNDRSGELTGVRAVLQARPVSGIESTINADLRAISLRQLERAAELAAARGEPLSPWARNLGGLVGIKYVVAQPERQDVLLVGPAGPWKLDAEGRAIGVDSGLPVLQLDDLVTCLRNARDWDGIFGCSITPRQENLAAAKEFLATTQLTGAGFREQLREKLGVQDVEVFGIAANSHLASILVEADYRMKLIGMGIEPSIPEVPSYLERVQLLADGSAPPLDVARWWFTLNYDQLNTDEQRLAFAFTGTGVKVLAETELVNQRGERIHTGKAVGPTKSFAEDFTEHFDKLARKYPIYHQLRGAFDLALVAAILEREHLFQRSGWEPQFFASPSKPGELKYLSATAPVARQVDSVMNHRIIRVRSGNKTSVHTLIGVSGGVHCDFGKWLDDAAGSRSRSADLPDSIKSLVTTPSTSERWWWDD